MSLPMHWAEQLPISALQLRVNRVQPQARHAAGAGHALDAAPTLQPQPAAVLMDAFTCEQITTLQLLVSNAVRGVCADINLTPLQQQVAHTLLRGVGAAPFSTVQQLVDHAAMSGAVDTLLKSLHQMVALAEKDRALNASAPNWQQTEPHKTAVPPQQPRTAARPASENQPSTVVQQAVTIPLIESGAAQSSSVQMPANAQTAASHGSRTAVLQPELQTAAASSGAQGSHAHALSHAHAAEQAMEVDRAPAVGAGTSQSTAVQTAAQSTAEGPRHPAGVAQDTGAVAMGAARPALLSTSQQQQQQVWPVMQATAVPAAPTPWDDNGVRTAQRMEEDPAAVQPTELQQPIPTAATTSNQIAQLNRPHQPQQPVLAAPLPPICGGANGANHGLNEDMREGGGVSKAWKEQIQAALALAHAPGTFACCGIVSEVPHLAPKVSVPGVARLAWPLCQEQAMKLMLAGEAVPLGPGMPDPEGCHAVQFDASRITIAPSWDPVMERVKNQALASLGVEESIIKAAEARLYKLLLYPAGGHFMPHRDTEKEPGMFATLIVQLPAGHEGGALEVTHAGKTFVWDSAVLSEEDIQYAAFFSDCQHQLKPTTQGWRILLAYNLVCTSPGPLPCPVSGSQALDQLTVAVKAWEAAGAAAQDRVALQLEHQYAEKDLAFEALKGKDAATVALLRACSLLDVHLEHVNQPVSACSNQGNTDQWNTDHGNNDGQRGKKRCWQGLENGADTHIINKISQLWLSPCGLLQSACGSRCDGHCHCHKKPRLANGASKELLPTDNCSHHFHDGHRAMVVIWPRSRAAKVACQGDFGIGLHLLAQRLQAANAAEQQLKQRQAQRAEELRKRELEQVQETEHSPMEGDKGQQGDQKMQEEVEQEVVVEAAVAAPKATQPSALTASLPDELVEALPEQIAAILPYRHMLPLDQQMKVHQLIVQIVQAHLPHLAASMGLEDTPASPERLGTTPANPTPQDAPPASPKPQDLSTASPKRPDAPLVSPDRLNKEVSEPLCNGGEIEERAEAEAREEVAAMEVLQHHQAQVLAVMEELAALAERAPMQCFPGTAAAGVHAVQLFRLLGDAIGLLDGRLADPASRLIHALGLSEGLCSSAVIQALGDLTSVHESSSVDAAVVALVRHCALSQMPQCVELALLPSLPERLQSQVSEAILRTVLSEGRFESVPVQNVAAVARLACRDTSTMSAWWAAVLARLDLLSVLPAMLCELPSGQATTTGINSMVTEPSTVDAPTHDYAVMQLLCQVSSRVSGMDQAKQALEQAAVRSITAAAGAVGVSSAAAGQVLAALAAALDSKVVDAAMVALVKACAPRQTSQCAELAMLPSLPDRLQRQVSEAVLSVLNNGQFASLSIESVRAIARLACHTGSALLELCLAVLARPDQQSVLAALLAEPVVREAVVKERANASSTTTTGPLASLVMARIQAQRAVLTWASTVSWAMPNASLPGYPQVEAFLRGPKQKEKFRIFEGLLEAKEFAAKYFSDVQGADYSATAVTGGRGANAFCEVTKTQEWQERKKKAAEVHERDVEQLLGLLGRTSNEPPYAPPGATCGLAMSTLTGRPSVPSNGHPPGPAIATTSGYSPAPTPSPATASTLIPGPGPTTGNRSGATPLAAPGLEFTIQPAPQPHSDHGHPPHPPHTTTASNVAALALSVMQGPNPAHALGATRLAGVPAPRLSNPGAALSGLNGLKPITNANGPAAHNLPGLDTLALWLLATAEQQRQQQQQLQARANSCVHSVSAATAPATALPAALAPGTVPAATPAAAMPAGPAAATVAPPKAAPAPVVPAAATLATALPAPAAATPATEVPAAATPAATVPAAAAPATTIVPATIDTTTLALPTVSTPAETGVATPVTAASASTTTAAAAPSTSGITACTSALAAVATATACVAPHMADSKIATQAGTSKPAEAFAAAEQPGGSVALLWSQLARKQKQQPRLQLKQQPAARVSQATPSPEPSQHQDKAPVLLHPPSEQPTLAPPLSTLLLPTQGGQGTMTPQQQQPDLAAPLPQQRGQPQQPGLDATIAHFLLQGEQPAMPSLLLPPDGHEPSHEAAGKGQAPLPLLQAEHGPSLPMPEQPAMLSPPPQASEQVNNLSQPPTQQHEQSRRAGVQLFSLPPLGEPQPPARAEGPRSEGEQPPPPLSTLLLQPLGGQDSLRPPETRMLQPLNDHQLAPLSPQLHPYPADQQLAPLSPQLHPDHEHEQMALLSPQLQPYSEHEQMPPLAALQPALQQQWSECELHAHLHASCSEGQALLLSPQLHQSESEELTLSLPLQQEHNSPCKPLTPMSSPQRLSVQHTAPGSPQHGRGELQSLLVRQQPVNARPAPLSPSHADLSAPTLLLRQQPVQHRPPPQLSQLMEHDMPTSPPAGQRQPSESEQNALSLLFMLLQQQDPAQPTPPSSQQASFQSDGQASWPLYQQPQPSWPPQYQHSPSYGDPQQQLPGYPYNMMHSMQQPEPQQQAGNLPKKGKGKGKGKGKQPAEAPTPATATLPPIPGTQQWAQQHWSQPQAPLQFPGAAGAAAAGAGWPQPQAQSQAAQQLMAPGIMSPQLAHAMGVMQQTIMQLGGNGVSQLIGLGQLAVGCRVAVLRPFVTPQWREAMVLQLAATGIVVTYGGADSDMLAPNTMNTVVRIL